MQAEATSRVGIVEPLNPMSDISAIGYKAFVGFALLVAVLGGVWFGLVACGGYAWHRWIMHGTLSALALVLLLLPPRHVASLSRRALLILGVFAAFVLVRAVAAPFYPVFPGFGDYFRLVGVALFTGPC